VEHYFAPGAERPICGNGKRGGSDSTVQPADRACRACVRRYVHDLIRLVPTTAGGTQ
jgi:hypothetical protein